MAFVTGNPASATVIIEQPTRAFVFEMEKLKKLVQGDESVAMAIHRVVGRDLAAKLKLQNDHEVAATNVA
jgi:CRP-like cAMP-binding protein